MLKYAEKNFIHIKKHIRSPRSCGLCILNSDFCKFINHIKLSKKKKNYHLVNLSKARTPLQSLCPIKFMYTRQGGKTAD